MTFSSAFLQQQAVEHMTHAQQQEQKHQTGLAEQQAQQQMMAAQQAQQQMMAEQQAQRRREELAARVAQQRQEVEAREPDAQCKEQKDMGLGGCARDPTERVDSSPARAQTKS